MRLSIPSANSLAVPVARPAVSRVHQQMLWSGYVLSLIISDLVMMALAFRVAFFVRFELSLGIFYQDFHLRHPFYENLVAWLLVVWLATFAGLGLYQRHRLLGGIEEYARTFQASTVSLLIVVVAGFLQPDFIVARGWLVLAWLLTFLFAAAGRFGLRRLVYAMRRHGLFLSRAVILGANAEGISLANQLRKWGTSGLEVVGFVDQKLAPGAVASSHLPVLGDLSHLDDIVGRHEVEEIILASSAHTVRDNLMTIFQRYGMDDRVNIRLSSGLYEIITTGLNVREFAYVPLVGVNKLRLTDHEQALKGLLDYALLLAAFVLVAPLLAIIAVAVRLDSPGPVIHRRRVMGTGGRQFDAFKFRTMHVDGDAILAAHPELKAQLERDGKLKHDPRVTRLGRFLRRTSLDELPQLINVLRREMSLVGPRMISPPEMEKYERWGMNLLTVKPGITGLWQVSGRSNISYQERVQLDMYYIRNWSIWLDLQLLWQTVPAVLRGQGAY